MHSRYRFPEDSYILLGKVVKAQGLHGEVSVCAFSGEAAGLRQYGTFTLVDKAGSLSPELKVTSFRVQKNRAIIGFDRVADRTFAEKLAGMGLLLNRRDLPEPAGDEFYWHTLFGLPVKTVQGQHLGTMQTIFSNGAQEVMVIGDGEQEYLIPVSQGMIVEQSNTGIVINPPPGLLSINAENDGS